MTEYDPAFVERVTRVKREVTEQLLGLPGVNLVAIGGKETGGRLTGELVVQVWVDEKLPLSQLPPEQRIPEEIDGVKTDVYVGGRITLVPAPGIKDLEDTEESKRYRKPGLQGGGRIKADGASGAGTMGCILHDPADVNIAYALTNQHVIQPPGDRAPTPGSTKVGQPTACASSSCCDDIIGTYSGGKRVTVLSASGNELTVRDEALVALQPGTKFVFDIVGIGYISGQYDVTQTDAAAHFPVRKRGARTRLTGGVVVSVEATGAVADNMMIIVPNSAPGEQAGDVVFFDAEGDSGSALVDDAAADSCRVTGLVYARGATRAELQALGLPAPPPPGGIERVNGYALPIANVIARFKDPANENIHVVVPQASAAGQVHTVPGASTAAVPAEVAERIAAEPAGLAGFVGDVAPDGGLRAPVGRAWFAEGRPREATLTALRERLEATAPGRLLIGSWLAHQEELARLVRTDRRVTLTWHRGGGAAIAQLFVRMVDQPGLALPETVNGRPLLDALDELVAVLSARGSPALRDDLAWVRRVLPDPAGRTLDEILFAVEAPRQTVGSDG